MEAQSKMKKVERNSLPVQRCSKVVTSQKPGRAYSSPSVAHAATASPVNIFSTQVMSRKFVMTHMIHDAYDPYTTHSSKCPLSLNRSDGLALLRAGDIKVL